MFIRFSLAWRVVLLPLKWLPIFKSFVKPRGTLVADYCSALPSSLSVSSLTSVRSLLMTFWQKCDRFASSDYTSLWIVISRCNVSIWVCILLFLNSNCSVYLDWYSSSMVSWVFWRIVSRVVVCNWSSLSESRLALVILICLSISRRNFSVACNLSLSA